MSRRHWLATTRRRSTASLLNHNSPAPAAVDFDGLAGDVGGEGGAEEEDDVGHFAGLAKAT